MIAVVGGGISGLSAAYALTKAGQPCALIEKRSRLGGVIETGTWENCVLEGGPDSFLAIKPEGFHHPLAAGEAPRLDGTGPNRPHQ